MAAADLLGVTPATMVGLMVTLWLWALDNAPEGDLAGIPDRLIARAASWNGDSGQFCSALQAAGFVDREGQHVSIHNWERYAGKLIDQRRANAERVRQFRARNAHVTVTKRACNALPDHTGPDRTIPDRTGALTHVSESLTDSPSPRPIEPVATPSSEGKPSAQGTAPIEPVFDLPAEPSAPGHVRTQPVLPATRKPSARRAKALIEPVPTDGVPSVPSARPVPAHAEQFSALALACGFDLAHLTRTARGELQLAAKDADEAGWDRATVLQKAEVYRKLHPEWEMTPSALVKHGPRLPSRADLAKQPPPDGRRPGGVTSAQVADLERVLGGG